MSETEVFYKKKKQLLTKEACERCSTSSGSLCWSCEKAVPIVDENEELIERCPWADHLKPVPGWNAIESDKFRYMGRESYYVLSCPIFERG